ncbi:anti-sigma factor antagonist [Pseudonocardia sp. C8]|uniref:anti-sigma factor antagonist n=1 Tax=Pseudonocardia sp. C8 TaxID=2762759 RepID=UPI0016432BC5|nr:anti-sigma factor antagonist [Pseudonocardia sp. C8]
MSAVDPARTPRPVPGRPPPSKARLREHTPRPGVTVLEVIGEIDLVEADAIRIRMTELLHRTHPERAVLDLSGVAFLGSHGLTAVVRASRAAGAAGVPLAGVTGPDNRAVIRPVRMTGLDRVITWFPDLSSALDPGPRV